MKPFKRDLKLGDEGPLVEDLQVRLIQLGFKTCFIEGGKSIGVLDEPTGHFGEITQNLVESFQAKVFDVILSQHIGLPVVIDPDNVVTGIMNHNTHYVLDNYEKLAEWYKAEIKAEEIEIPKEPEPLTQSNKILLLNKSIEIAKGELGVIEHGGNNYGDRVEEYQRIGSNGECNGGAPWCQYVQNWVVINACKKLGLTYKGLYSGYTPTWVNWGKTKGIVIINPSMEEIEVGDYLYIYSSSRNNACHVAQIRGKKKATVLTYEGNTNPGGGSDGYGFFGRERAMPWAILKWHKLYN